VAGESGVASRSAGSATAVQDAPVAGDGSMGSQSPTCRKRHEVCGFSMISNQFQSIPINSNDFQSLFVKIMRLVDLRYAFAKVWPRGNQRVGHAAKCLLRRQTTSQRDTAHQRWVKGSQAGSYHFFWGGREVFARHGALVAGESGVASRSAGSATAVQDAPVAGNGSMGSQSPTCHKRHEVWGFPMISNQFQSVLKKLRGESQPRPALAIGGGKIPFAPAGFKGEIKRHASC